MAYPKTGDFVFFYVDGVPASGEVLCTGRSGMKVATDESPDGIDVPWSEFAAIKQRGPTDYEILEDGEDGMIVRDHKGYPRFISKTDPTVDGNSPESLKDGSNVATIYGDGVIVGSVGADGAHVRLQSGKMVQVTFEQMNVNDTTAAVDPRMG